MVGSLDGCDSDLHHVLLEDTNEVFYDIMAIPPFWKAVVVQTC